MRQDIGVFFLDETQAVNAALPDNQNGEPDPRSCGQNERHRPHGVGIENADARGGEAGDTDLQKAQHGGRAADVAVERHERQRGGVQIARVKAP